MGESGPKNRKLKFHKRYGQLSFSGAYRTGSTTERLLNRSVTRERIQCITSRRERNAGGSVSKLDVQNIASECNLYLGRFLRCLPAEVIRKL